jgi:hypothetical protein
LLNNRKESQQINYVPFKPQKLRKKIMLTRPWSGEPAHRPAVEQKRIEEENMTFRERFLDVLIDGQIGNVGVVFLIGYER